MRYCYRSFEPDELAVYYAAADVALVTPLADGVSFVPFEYLAARTREDGALVLSSLAGAADALPEATIVNPYDEDGVAGALHGALEARPDDARLRMRALRERSRRHDVRAWLGGFWRATWDEALPLPAPAPPVGPAGDDGAQATPAPAAAEPEPAVAAQV